MIYTESMFMHLINPERPTNQNVVTQNFLGALRLWILILDARTRYIGLGCEESDVAEWAATWNRCTVRDWRTISGQGGLFCNPAPPEQQRRAPAATGGWPLAIWRAYANVGKFAASASRGTRLPVLSTSASSSSDLVERNQRTQGLGCVDHCERRNSTQSGDDERRFICGSAQVV